MYFFLVVYFNLNRMHIFRDKKFEMNVNLAPITDKVEVVKFKLIFIRYRSVVFGRS